MSYIKLKQKGEMIQLKTRDGESIKETLTVSTDGKDHKILTEFKKSFISYFSIGYDARVGFGINLSD